jgi:hypothetical protein
VNGIAGKGLQVSVVLATFLNVPRNANEEVRIVEFTVALHTL